MILVDVNLLVSCDEDFGRMPGLRWRNPLTGAASSTQ